MIPTGAKVGDKLVLTKPLGMQLAVNSFQWLKGDMKQWQVAREFISEEQVLDAFAQAAESMATLNLKGARAIRKYNVKACTDVTGFGILGHAKYLSYVQKQNLLFEIDALPVNKHL